MNQYDISTFLAVVHSRSFSKAAAILYSTQATISHRIVMMEKELGYTLLNRGQGLRNVELTDRGEQFVPIAEQMETLWESAQAIERMECQTLLAVGGTNRLNTHFLPAFYDRFSRDNRSIIPEIRSYHSSEITELIDRRELDVGFVSTECHMKDIVTVPFLKEPIVMICPKGDYYGEEKIQPETLDIRNEVKLAVNPEIQNWHNYWWKRTAQPYVYADTATIVACYLTQPQLWAICPCSAAKSLQERYPLEIHEFGVKVPFQTSFLLYHQSPKANKAAALHKFIEAFQQYYLAEKTDGFLL